MWNASRFCVSSLRRGHANLLCIVPIENYQSDRSAIKRPLVTASDEAALGVKWALLFCIKFSPFKIEMPITARKRMKRDGQPALVNRWAIDTRAI